MNLVAFVGNIVEPPKLRESAMGNKFAVMEINVRRAFPNSEGVYEVDTLAVTLWKGIAQTTSEVAQKGDTVAVKGRIQSHTFEGNDGQQHRSYDITAEYVSLIQREGQS